MSKKKNQRKAAKSGKKKPATQKSSKGSGTKPSGMGAMMTAHQVCSITNPFCPEAHGAKWPDGQYTRSATYDIDGGIVDVVTNASGDGAVLFVPGLTSHYYTTTGITAGSVAYAGSSNQVLVAPANVTRFRITSWGLRIVSPLAPMTVTGFVRVRLFSPLKGATLNPTSINSIAADESYDIPLSRLVGKDYHILPKPFGTEARLFRDRATEGFALASWDNPGWQVVQIAVQGGPVSSYAIQVYAYYHYEVLFADGDALNTFSSVPPPNNPVVKETANTVIGKIGGFIEGAAEKIDNLFKSKTMKLLTSGVATAYGGPQAGSAAYMIMDKPRNVD